MLYVPSDYDENSSKRYPLIVLVHGTERGPHYYLEQNREFAEEHGVILLAPLFPVGTHGGGHFAHRFFCLHPHRLRAVSIGATGATYNSAGRNRVERLRTLEANWEKHGIDVRFETVEGAGHDETDMFPAMQKFFVEAIPLGRSPAPD